jgi:phage-related protein
MPPLIYVAPDTANFPLAPDKYAALIAKLKTDSDASNLAFSDGFPYPLSNVAGSGSGSVTYQKIDFTWTYDGVGQLTVKIIADRNWKAKIAGNDVVFQRLNDDLISTV